jgi:tetratricopeptide (TPR) repeat protein
MAFAVVSLFDPPWLEALSHPGAKAEAISYADRGNACVRDKNFPAALGWYERALKAHPDHVPARVNAAVVYGQLGRFDEGLRLLRDALDTETRQRGLILYNVAEIHFKKGDPAAAVDSYNEAIAAGFKVEVIHARLGEIREAAGDLPGAREELRAALRAWEDPMTSYRNMLAAAKESITEEPEVVRDIEAALARGTSPEELARYDVELIRQQIDRDPAIARVMGHLGMIEEQLGDTAAAGHLRRALDMWPANPQASAYREALSRAEAGRRPATFGG